MKDPRVGRTMIRRYKQPTSLRSGKWGCETVEYEVRVMAIAEGYAMVRRKRAMPTVCEAKELHEEGKSI